MNILFPTDLLAEHQYLIEKACSIAKKFKAKLFLLHVIELPATIQLAQGLGFTELANPAKDDAETVLATIGDTFDIPASQLYVEVGSVKEHIFNKAEDLDCQMIIVGNHASTALDAVMGSTAHAVIQHAPCDVLILRL